MGWSWRGVGGRQPKAKIGEGIRATPEFYDGAGAGAGAAKKCFCDVLACVLLVLIMGRGMR